MRLADALDPISILCPALSAADCAPRMQPIIETATLLTESRKHRLRGIERLALQLFDDVDVEASQALTADAGEAVVIGTTSDILIDHVNQHRRAGRDSAGTDYCTNAAHRGARTGRTGRRPGIPESGKPAAHRLIQDSRCLQYAEPVER